MKAIIKGLSSTLQFILDRLKEPSTWIGIGVALGLFGGIIPGLEGVAKWFGTNAPYLAEIVGLICIVAGIATPEGLVKKAKK